LIDNLIHTLSIYLLNIIVAKECFQLRSIDLSISILVKQLEKFADVASGKEILLGEGGS
jgi:hypothetical protein